MASTRASCTRPAQCRLIAKNWRSGPATAMQFTEGKPLRLTYMWCTAFGTKSGRYVPSMQLDEGETTVLIIATQLQTVRLEVPHWLHGWHVSKSLTSQKKRFRWITQLWSHNFIALPSSPFMSESVDKSLDYHNLIANDTAVKSSNTGNSLPGYLMVNKPVCVHYSDNQHPMNIRI